MKKRIEALEATQKTDRTDKEQIIQLAKRWRDAAAKQEWKKAISIREEAEPLFEDHPVWIDDPKELRLKKDLFMCWRWFAGYLKRETRQQYVKAIKEGVNPGFVLISSK